MKKPSSKIREEITKLQEQLRQAETREAERIGRIALKGGLGEVEIDDTDLQAAFEALAGRFGPRRADSVVASQSLSHAAKGSQTPPFGVEPGSDETAEA
ncbi:conjugal transfer protein TraC [Rhizobium sp. BK313]|uniref:conjugal transfer protein TraC n=1 Tax=Rhizobium sp. BK313 TaxID=2587081 RepID=UPI001060C568|nr:conjugal transfer protein TraC [Rhizobium sp. BK313]